MTITRGGCPSSRRLARQLPSRLLLVAAVTALLLPDGARGEPGKVVTLFDYYPARQAAFGADVPEWGWINLMLPPRNQSSLCEYPSVALPQPGKNNATEDLPQNRVNVKIGLLVAMGNSNCSAEDQARNAVRLKYEGGVSLLRYLIIEGDPGDGNVLGVIFPESNATSELSELVVLGTTYRAGQYLRDDIRAYQQDSADEIPGGGRSPYLYDEASVDWDMVGNIDPYRFATEPANSDNFYWFRILLFTLLIVSPCLRAAYLWWAGGGRFRLRRNEEGRITGIRYVRPVPHWLSSGMIPGARPSAPPSDVLTEEEFQALPEIEFKPRDDTEAGEDDIDVEAGAASPEQAPAERSTAQVPPALSTNRVEPLAPMESAPSTPTTSSPAVGDAGAGNVFESTCTLCSICIDDFVAGEKLVLLPRCRHSFHRECIHPWLTERQGCCPLCKTSVLEKDGGGGGDDDARTAQNADSSSDSSTSTSDNTRRIRNRDDPSSTAAMTTVGELDESSEESEESLPAPCDGRRRPNDERRSGP